MAIAPVTSSSLGVKNYNRVGFEGRKNKNLDYQTNSNHSTSSLKTVPMIMLFALNPSMLDAATHNNVYTEPEPIEVFQAPQASKNKVLARGSAGDIKTGFSECTLEFISTDGDDSNAERLDLILSRDFSYRLNVDGKDALHVATETRTVTVDTLKTQNVTERNKDGSVRHYKRYFVTGPGKLIKVIKNEDAGTVTNRQIKDYDTVNLEIPEVFYNDLKTMMGDEAVNVVENVTLTPATKKSSVKNYW